MRQSRVLMISAASILASAATAAPLPTADVLTQQGPGLWRASKLLGVTVYGPENKRDGEISDVLIDHAGHAAYVVIGVGGFLGLGQKDVALPYDQVRFTDQPMDDGPGSTDRGQAGAMGAGLLGGAMDAGTMGRMSGSVGGSDVPPRATGTGSDPGTGGGMASNASGTGTETGAAVGSTGSRGGAGAATPDRITAYPNHGTINLTADQLKAAPSFRYAD